MKDLRKSRSLPGLVAIGLLSLVTLVAFANAWPDVLVHDDKFFAGTAHAAGWKDIPRFFTEDLWAATGAESGLYRPLLLASLALESRAYGDWLAGYHLDNILLHLLVTLVVYGFLRQVARTAMDKDSSSRLFALLAALVFAVHPVHTEVVNSIYNRSEMLVALAAAGGLWWLLHFLEARPGLSWSGLAACYLFALFSKESAIVIPAIAVVLVLILAPGPWVIRMRTCLPVFWLLLPLALYLALRAQALAPESIEGVKTIGVAAQTSAIAGQASLPGFARISETIGVWGHALWLMVWPDPLLLFHGQLSTTRQWVSLAVQIALLVVAVLQFRTRHYGLLAGLMFFYIALLPASRILGSEGAGPHLAERYLYFPSVGLAISLAAGFTYLGRRWGAGSAVILALIALMLLTPLTWKRNGDWASELGLFESEYRRGRHGPEVLRLLSAAYISAGTPGRAAEICDERSFEHAVRRRYANHCGIAYSQLGRNEDAERAFQAAVRGDSVEPVLYANLAQFYLRQGRRLEAIEQYERAVKAEKDPAFQAYRRGEMLVILYPSDRLKLAEARSHFAEAIHLQPRLASAQQWLDRLDRALERP